MKDATYEREPHYQMKFRFREAWNTSQPLFFSCLIVTPRESLAAAAERKCRPGS